MAELEKAPRVSVAAPAYNEAESIENVVRKWVSVLEASGETWEIIIADDGSTDGTGRVLETLGEPRLRVVSFPENHGYGHALSRAMALARGEFVVTIDSDGQFDLFDFAPLLASLEKDGLDLVTGYRTRKKDTAVKVMADWVLNLIVRLIFGLDLRDTNCALKVMTREAAQKLRIEAMGFPTPTEIMARAAGMGYRIGEGPVKHLPRAGGKSKLQAFPSGVQFLVFLLYLRLQLWLAKWKVLQGNQT